MKRSNAKGFSLIELMVALVIGSLAALVIQQVMAVFEGQKRTSTGGSDAQVNGAVALMQIEREIRQAGFGLPTGMCQGVVNDYVNGTIIPSGGILPIRIRDGGDCPDGSDCPDAIEFSRSDADFGAVPIAVMADFKMTDPPPGILVESTGGLTNNQLFLVGASDASSATKTCTLMRMSQNPEYDEDTQHWILKPNPPNAAPDPGFVHETYVIRDVVINMGSVFTRSYEIDDSTDPPKSQLVFVDSDGTPQPSVDQIVDLQAQYGIADAADSQQITHWCDATEGSKCGNWSDQTSGDFDIARVRALRIAVVARSVQYEKEEVSPASLSLWSDVDEANDDAAPSYAPPDRHYRYKVFSTIVPIRYLIWGNS